MTHAPGDLDRFQALIERRFGLTFDDSRLPFLAELLHRRGTATAGGIPAYLDEVDRGLERSPALRTLAADLTVPETYFFRHAEQLRALLGAALPARWEAIRRAGKIRVLSAGCATGEEAYTLAMVLRDAAEQEGVAAEVVALDVNPAALERARRGRYGAWALRETPEEIRRRWFEPDGKEHVISPELRRMVRFEEHNLTQPDPVLLAPESYDAIYCRNVLMYFAPAAGRRVVERLGAAVRPGGFLFLGHAETLRGVSDGFHLHHTHGTFYYRRKDGTEPRRTPPPRARHDVPLIESSWVETIRASSERVERLVPTPAAPAVGPAAGLPEVEQAFALLGEERFGDALIAANAVDSAATDPDLLLLRATLQVHAGELIGAEACCRALLAKDELNAGAHFVLALCHEARGDGAAAVEEDLTALYLDPSFAIPRLHLGILYRRRKSLGAARQALEHALWALRGEEPARLLLFGGGFGREALIGMCAAELQACGGAR